MNSRQREKKSAEENPNKRTLGGNCLLVIPD